MFERFISCGDNNNKSGDVAFIGNHRFPFLVEGLEHRDQSRTTITGVLPLVEGILLSLMVRAPVWSIPFFTAARLITQLPRSLN